MDFKKLLTRTAARYSPLAPFIGPMATFYGIYNAFRSLSSSVGAGRAVIDGLVASLIATAILIVAVGSAAALYDLLRRSNDDYEKGTVSTRTPSRRLSLVETVLLWLALVAFFFLGFVLLDIKSPA